MADLKVEKKDGSLEDFDSSKISSGVIKAGATQEQADAITTEVTSWANQSAADGTVKTGDIRVQVLAKLRAANPEAAAKFEAYKKPQ